MKNLNLDSLSINWFDFTLVVLLMVGLLRGRKRGMSQEFLDLIKWLAIVGAAAFLYQPLGAILTGNRIFSLLFGYIVAYLLIVMVILTLFIFVKRAIGGKMIGSDAFGRAEYPLGMVSGCIRFACMTIVVLALMNARSYNSYEVAAETKFQKDVYGSQFFPTFQTVQAQVLKKSMTGSWMRKNLALLLIKPTAPEKKELRPKSDLP